MSEITLQDLKSQLDRIESLLQARSRRPSKKKEASLHPDARSVLAAYNKICNRNVSSDAYLVAISARLNEGATERQCIEVIKTMQARWRGTDQEQYLFPSTLFRRNNFPRYLALSQDAHKRARLPEVVI